MESHVKILMVDDRPENLMALEAVFAEENYVLVKAASGEQALKMLLKDDDYAVILMDVQMPGLDGFETARLIKAHTKFKYIPLIFITAHHIQAKHITEGYSVGAIDYISKPYEPILLKSKIECFVSLYQLNKLLITQKELLKEKTMELEKTNKELNKASQELRRSEALARITGETSIDTIITMNRINKIITVNPALKSMFGYEETEICGIRIESLFESFDMSKYEIGTLYEMKGIRKNGDTFPVEIQLGEARIDNELIYACTVRDITERKAQIEKLEYQALYDPLTGLPNRILLYDRLEQAIIVSQREEKSFALFLLDLDNFKEINDTLGHHVGDIVLKLVGERLLSGIRKSDTVSRLGGDEFAVLLQPSGGCHPNEIADKITNLLSAPFQVEGNTLSISASIGIATFPEHGEDISILMRRVDIAMYAAKRNGSDWRKYSTALDL